MALRSDFEIHVPTPEAPSIDTKVKSIFTEKADRDLASILDQIAEKETRFAVTAAAAPAPPAPAPAPPPARPHRVAFLVTHGMGQQVPFETVSAVGQALITEHSTRSGAAGSDNLQVQVRRVRLTATDTAPELSRVEVTLPPQNGQAVEAHIYESYWAPYTAGQISFTETAKFLYLAAWNGLTTYYGALREQRQQRKAARKQQPADPAVPKPADDGFKHFDRWMFGKFQDMPIKSHTVGLLLAALISVTLLLLPAVLVFTPAGAKVISLYKDHYLHWSLLVQSAIALAAIVIVALALIVRYFVVEYVGDVAIYVSSYKVSRFDAIRTKILEEACSVARQIYSAGITDNSHPKYDHVVIVGHSLGSVISYDTLNACINWDQIECNFDRQVVPRTSRLITFGSPLDKTAFLFRTQVSSARNIREALAARKQPLILDYEKFRPLDSFRWINIHAPADIISGRLAYYDASDTTGLTGINRVQNVIDPEAKTPLLAHVQYWNNSMLHQTLYEAALAHVPVPSP